LRAEKDDLVARQNIAQAVQRADQRGVGLGLVAPAQPLGQIVDPGLCYFGRAVDFRQLST